jgi:dephospho-CoA kinase
MLKPRRIGLIGFTGVGKSTVAKRLKSNYGCQICSTGAMCRAVSRLAFGNEDKSNLMALTDALQSIDPLILLKAAIRRVGPEDNIVLDALRYLHDYKYARQHGLFVMRVTAPVHLRRAWLAKRGQRFDFDIDSSHPSETQLASVRVHATLRNDSSRKALFARLDAIMDRMK